MRADHRPHARSRHALDRQLRVLPGGQPGGQALVGVADPGGKGINVSRALALNGATTRAILPVGGGHGRMMLELLQDAATPVITVPIRGAIRANVAIVEPDGTTTKVNELGPVLDLSLIHI